MKMRTARISIVLLALAWPLLGQEGKSRPSPPATAKLNLGGKEISVDYSQPKIRDPKTGEQRKIFGGLVPYGKVWRTGANEATTLKTEGALEIGGSSVPAGTYTLFTIPEQDKWTLIISKKTGEGGDHYPGEKEDLLRVPMELVHPSEITDPFTVTLLAGRPDTLTTMGVGSGTAPPRLCFAWEHTRACVPLAPK